MVPRFYEKQKKKKIQAVAEKPQKWLSYIVISIGYVCVGFLLIQDEMVTEQYFRLNIQQPFEKLNKNLKISMIQFMYINIYSVLYMHTNTFRHIINRVIIYQNANWLSSSEQTMRFFFYFFFIHIFKKFYAYLK